MAYRDRSKAKAAVGDNDGAKADLNMALKLSPDKSSTGDTSSAKLPLDTDQTKQTTSLMKPTAQANVPDSYEATVAVCIKKYWTWVPVVKEETKKVSVTFSVDAAGVTSHVAIKESSGNKFYDFAAMKAVRTAWRVPPPPSELKPPLQLTYTFDFSLGKKRVSPN
jgi:TonB family protein